MTDRRKALGSNDGFDPLMRAALSDEDFKPLPEPGPHDWLANHPEPGQTLDEYRISKPNRPAGKRKTIYLQPVGEFTTEQESVLSGMHAFMKSFFQVDVVLQNKIALERSRTIWRKNPFDGHDQVLATSIMDNLLVPGIPEDAFSVLGITRVDLYPEPSWNFVFGQAYLYERAGIYSLARYDPAFYGEPRTADSEKLILRRALKVAVHETGHMFGIQHCIHHSCVMNGSNHLAESDGRPLFLCPVCLRKLQWNIDFDALHRYKDMKAVLERLKLAEDVQWLSARIERIEKAIGQK